MTTSRTNEKRDSPSASPGEITQRNGSFFYFKYKLENKSAAGDRIRRLQGCVEKIR